MASHDAGWETFRDELRHWMDLRRVTSRMLAARLEEVDPGASFDEHVVKRWRHSTAPPLSTVRHIAAILAMSDDPSGHAPHDPAFLLRRMGLLAEAAPSQELLDTAYRLQELRLKVLDVRADLGRHSARTGAGQLVQTALSHGYAAAVLPVWDGPAGYPMHVADRLDFRASRPGQAPIEADPDLQAALVANFAVPGFRTPRFSTCEEDLAQQSHWAIQLVGRPFSRVGKALHPAAPAVAVTSSTTTAWPDDVGAILAWLLGYGFVTTREIARELTPNPIATDALRNEVHEQFLHRPPTHHVWSHHSVTVSEDNPHAPWATPEAHTPPGLVHIRLVEDDDVLAWTAPWLAATLGLDEDEALMVARENRDEVGRRLASDGLASVRSRTLLVRVRHAEASPDRWDGALNAVLAATVLLTELGVTRDATLDAIHDRLVRDEPDIAPSLLRWLADHECPLVSTKFSSRSTRV